MLQLFPIVTTTPSREHGTRRVSIRIPVKIKKVWELFLHYTDGIVKIIGFLEGRNPVQPECEQKD